jgi:hypothetical protein
MTNAVSVYSYFRDIDNVGVHSTVILKAQTGIYETVFTVWYSEHHVIRSIVGMRNRQQRREDH